MSDSTVWSIKTQQYENTTLGCEPASITYYTRKGSESTAHPELKEAPLGPINWGDVNIKSSQKSAIPLYKRSLNC